MTAAATLALLAATLGPIAGTWALTKIHPEPMWLARRWGR